MINLARVAIDSLPTIIRIGVCLTCLFWFAFDCNGQVESNRQADPVGNDARGHEQRLPFKTIVQTAFRHTGEINDVAVSADGRMVASAARDGLKVWSTSSGRLLHSWAAHAKYGSGRVYRIAFTSDSNFIVSGGFDSTCRVWDLKTGKQRLLIRCHHFGNLGIVHAIRVAISHDGQRIITGGHHGVIQVWDFQSGEQLTEIGRTKIENEPHRFNILGLSVHPNDKTVAVSGENSQIRIIDLSGLEPETTLETNLTFVPRVRFSHDGTTLAWCGYSRDAKQTADIVLFDLKDEQIRRQLNAHHQNRTYDFKFSKDGKRMVSVGFGNTVKLWDLKEETEIWTAQGHRAIARSVDWNEQTNLIVTGGNDEIVRLWHSPTGIEKKTEGFSTDSIVDIATRESGQFITAHRDGHLHFWKESGERVDSLRVCKVPEQDDTLVMQLSPRANYLSWSANSIVEMWHVSDRKKLWRKNTNRLDVDEGLDPSHISGLYFSNNENFLLTRTVKTQFGSGGAICRVWNVQSGEQFSKIKTERNIRSGPRFVLNTIGLVANTRSPNEFQIQDPRLEFFHVQGERKHQIKSFETLGELFTAAGEQQIILSKANGLLQFRNARTGEIDFSLLGPWHGFFASSIAFSAERTKLAASSPHGILVWNLANGQLTHKYLLPANQICFSHDGTKLFVGDATGAIQIVDLSNSHAARARDWDDSELQKRWLDLASGRDSTIGEEARSIQINALVEAGDDAIRFLDKQLFAPNSSALNRKAVRRATDDLTQKDRKTRMEAIARVERFGDKVVKVMNRFDVHNTPVNNFAREQIEVAIMKGMRIRRDRYVFDVIQQIGTRQAEKLLFKLVKKPTSTGANENRKQTAQKKLVEMRNWKIRRSIEPLEGL